MKNLLVAIALAALSGVVSTAAPQAAFASAQVGSLGDLSAFQKIAADTLSLVDKGDLAAARKRITDFETAWDKDASRLRAVSADRWGVIDDAADAAIAALRAKKPVAATAKSAVTGLVAALKQP